MNKTIILLIFIISLITNYSNAQTIRNSKEASDNNKAIVVSKQQLELDAKQLAAFKLKVNSLETAFSKAEMVKVKALKNDLLEDMQREIEQSERKIAQDEKELKQSKTERNASKREKRRSRRDLNNNDRDLGEGRNLRKDRRDVKDDRRDVNDDRADLNRQIARTNRQKEIIKSVKAFNFSTEHSIREKVKVHKALLYEFIKTMEADIAETKAELNEDRVEKQEDKRERKEDRLQRRIGNR